MRINSVQNYSQQKNVNFNGYNTYDFYADRGIRSLVSAIEKRIMPKARKIWSYEAENELDISMPTTKLAILGDGFSEPNLRQYCKIFLDIRRQVAQSTKRLKMLRKINSLRDIKNKHVKLNSQLKENVLEITKTKLINSTDSRHAVMYKDGSMDVYTIRRNDKLKDVASEIAHFDKNHEIESVEVSYYYDDKSVSPSNMILTKDKDEIKVSEYQGDLEVSTGTFKFFGKDKILQLHGKYKQFYNNSWVEEERVKVGNKYIDKFFTKAKEDSFEEVHRLSMPKIQNILQEYVYSDKIVL